MAPIPQAGTEESCEPYCAPPPPTLCRCTAAGLGPLFALVVLITFAFAIKCISIRQLQVSRKIDSFIAYVGFICCFALLVTGIISKS